MDVSKNKGTPKSSILIGFSFINHPFWDTPILGNPHMNNIVQLNIHKQAVADRNSWHRWSLLIAGSFL